MRCVWIQEPGEKPNLHEFMWLGGLVKLDELDLLRWRGSVQPGRGFQSELWELWNEVVYLQ